MSKRDFTLLIVTVLLVGILIFCFVYDRTGALINRTNPYEFAEDDNLKIIATEKKGFLFRRVYYEVKMEVKDGSWEQYYAMFKDMYNAPGEMMSDIQYKDYEAKSLATAKLRPVPASGSVVWLSGLEYDDHALIYICDKEADGKAYFYIYYSRK